MVDNQADLDLDNLGDHKHRTMTEGLKYRTGSIGKEKDYITLENIKEKWGKKYPYAISNWENNWEDVSSFFQFSNDIRRIMYTTNIIEGLNRQYRKVTKTICSKADHDPFPYSFLFHLLLLTHVTFHM